MKGSKHPANDVTLNPSGNESIHDVIGRTDMSRRTFIKTAISASVLSAIGGVTMSGIVRSVHAAPIPPANGFAGIGFESIPPKVANVPSTLPVFADAVEVPSGYKVEVLGAWGQPIMPGAPDWNPDASQDASAQERQMGMHHDGMHFFPFPQRGGGTAGVSSDRGLLCVNHEYTHEEVLHTDGLVGAGYTIAKARKSQAAHGVSVCELRRVNGKWSIFRNSPFGRRITANTPMRVSGPAAGNSLLKSRKYDLTPAASVPAGLNDGLTAFGTANNCAHGYTPWGTYLTCEENWNGYFAAPTRGAAIGPEFQDQKAEILANGNRYGISQTGFGYRWHTVDERWNADLNPLEPNLFGYVVEIDPFAPAGPNAVPVKRTALGRFKHESAQVAVSSDAAGTPNRVAFYMGDDERNEYIYKFVCDRPFSPTNRAANRNLLDQGTLYVARFTDTPVAGKPETFRGVWIPLVPDTDTVIPNPAGGVFKLRDLETFAARDGGGDAEVQGRICVLTRQAADAVGATMMDRPEWTALRTYFDPGSASTGYSTYNAERPLEAYCTLTNNNRRGSLAYSGPRPNPTPAPGQWVSSVNQANGSTGAGAARPPVDVANPRPDNRYGHIIRWREDGNHVTATAFEWDIFVLCGDSTSTRAIATVPAAPAAIGATGTIPVYFNPAGADYRGNIVDNPPGSADFGAPDGLWFDQFGRMWVQTDQQGDAAGDWVKIGANVMVCADPNTKEVRRFLTSPPNCEVTGVINTPDGKTMFVNIQHPGEDSTAGNPTEFSSWPQAQYATNSAGEPLAVVGGAPQAKGADIRPRSATLVITREDGGVIGGV